MAKPRPRIAEERKPGRFSSRASIEQDVAASRPTSVDDARIAVDPVRLPRPAAVFRERLLGLGRPARQLLHRKANEDGPPANRFLVVEHAASVLELSDH